MSKNLFLLVCASILFFSCTSNDKKIATEKDIKNFKHLSKDTAINDIPDSIFLQIHQIIDTTSEYLSLKEKYKTKLQLLVFPKEKSTYEVNIGHVISERFSTSLRWNINLSLKEIKMHDPHKNYEEITLKEFRRRHKKYNYNSYL